MELSTRKRFMRYGKKELLDEEQKRLRGSKKV